MKTSNKSSKELKAQLKWKIKGDKDGTELTLSVELWALSAGKKLDVSLERDCHA